MARIARCAFGTGVAGLMALVAAPAEAQVYSSCAGIQNAFAYNACLASHGPQAHETLPGSIPANADKPWAARHPAAAPAAGAGFRFSRRRNGRMTMQFTLSDPPAAAHRRHAVQ
jgi:hypothetical protein